MDRRIDPKKSLCFKFKKPINLYAFTDVHIGAKDHDKAKFSKVIAQLKADPNGYCFFNGDNLDFTPNGYHDATQQQSEGNDEQMENFTKLIRSLGKKVLFIRPGNHELRAALMCDVNILDHIGRECDVPVLHSGNQIVYVWIGERRLTLVTSHGEGGNSKAVLTRLADDHPHADLYFIGHTHEFTNYADGRVIVDATSGEEEILPAPPRLVGGSFQGYSDHARRRNMRRGDTGCYILALNINGVTVKERFV